ncbi:MAG: hypothetical protein BGO98_28640 [Myxococcales bacterium 68-20]|nr:hypothetical protein [Myxococcales bacterium]OJY30672.1 MAG: hypothetical protein BGO98_28640 [Myxococcales bacterium 68-20]
MRSVLAISLLLVACSSSSSSDSTSSSSGGSSSGGGTPVSAADCNERCKPKATECGAPEEQIAGYCANLCQSATQEQLACLEQKTCGQLLQAGSAEAACPKSSSSSSSSSSSGGTAGKKQLGDSCTCSDASPSGDGLCGGTDVDCDRGLYCVYSAGTGGKGTCMGKRCCDDTNACDEDPSLLESCSVGTCKTSVLGYYCQK